MLVSCFRLVQIMETQEVDLLSRLKRHVHISRRHRAGQGEPPAPAETLLPSVGREVKP